MLTVSQVTKSFGGRVLYKDASLQVNRGDRIGLVGPNGAGKTTLFSLIMGHDEPDEGRVTLQRSTTVGFLPQESAPAGDETVLALAMAVSPEMEETLRQLQANTDPEEHETHEAISRFAELDGHALEAKAKRILSGLAFRETDFHRPAHTLSGGWVMRAHLAKLLVMEPDLLLLDEPTNHLDLESLLWFQTYLKGYPGAILMISHDRAFLNALCTTIVEVARGSLSRFRGNYDTFVTERAAREEQYLAAYLNQEREIERLQDFVNRFRAKASKAAQAQEKLKQIDRIRKLEAPVQADATVKFKFPQPVRSGHRVLTFENAFFSYGENPIYRDLNLLVERDQRTVLVGPNGAGKSTLLKLLGGVMPLNSGERALGHNVTVGYYAQYRSEMFKSEHTVLEEALDGPRMIPEQTVRTLLGAFLFRGDDVFKRVTVLSGGEKSRLALVKLLLDPPNLLLMDEPTTHLDMPSIDALVQALKDYQGTLVFISHDVYFIRALASTVLHVHAGQLTPYAGNYDYYLDKSKAQSERHGLTAHGRADAPEEKEEVVDSAPRKGMREVREERRRESEARQKIARAKKEHNEKVTSLEKEVLRLEEQIKSLSALLETPEVHQQSNRMVELNRELAAAIDKLDATTTEWEIAVDSLAGKA
ncbi:MAG: ribosomal protection-like ABC-F family protein [Chthoniobacterales bacterium]